MPGQIRVITNYAANFYVFIGNLLYRNKYLINGMHVTREDTREMIKIRRSRICRSSSAIVYAKTRKISKIRYSRIARSSLAIVRNI